MASTEDTIGEDVTIILPVAATESILLNEEKVEDVEGAYEGMYGEF